MRRGSRRMGLASVIRSALMARLGRPVAGPAPEVFVSFTAAKLSTAAKALALATLVLTAWVETATAQTSQAASAGLGQTTTGLLPCRVDGLKKEVLCGSLRRPLDPSRPSGVHIDIGYVVVPALARRKHADPVMLLAGGPGQSATALAPQVVAWLARLNNRRDLVLVDQRGTGRSAPLACPDEPANLSIRERLDAARSERMLRDCRLRLQTLPYGDLRFFTTTLAMQDLDAVRAQLGAERVNLVGASYGTRAALEYLRLYPSRVRRVVIDGVAPPDMVLPSSFSTDNQAALDAVFARCEAEAACTKAFPSLRTTWSGLLQRLPLEVSARHPSTGAVERVRLERSAVLAMVRGPLYSPALAAGLPAAIAQAASGRWEALLGLATAAPRQRGAEQLAAGMHYSVVCAEDVPRLASAVDRPGADFGADQAEHYAHVCANWPRGEVPAGFYDIAPSAAAVLVASGGDDPVTPPRHAERVVQRLGPLARHVVVAHAGHGVLSVGCMRDVLARFVDAERDAEALAVDATCANALPAPPAFIPLGVTLTQVPAKQPAKAAIDSASRAVARVSTADPFRLDVRKKELP